MLIRFDTDHYRRELAAVLTGSSHSHNLLPQSFLIYFFQFIYIY